LVGHLDASHAPSEQLRSGGQVLGSLGPRLPDVLVLVVGPPTGPAGAALRPDGLPPRLLGQAGPLLVGLVVRLVLLAPGRLPVGDVGGPAAPELTGASRALLQLPPAGHGAGEERPVVGDESEPGRRGEDEPLEPLEPGD